MEFCISNFIFQEAFLIMPFRENLLLALQQLRHNFLLNIKFSKFTFMNILVKLQAAAFRSFCKISCLGLPQL